MEVFQQTTASHSVLKAGMSRPQLQPVILCQKLVCPHQLLIATLCQSLACPDHSYSQPLCAKAWHVQTTATASHSVSKPGMSRLVTPNHSVPKPGMSRPQLQPATLCQSLACPDQSCRDPTPTAVSLFSAEGGRYGMKSFIKFKKVHPTDKLQLTNQHGSNDGSQKFCQTFLQQNMGATLCCNNLFCNESMLHCCSNMLTLRNSKLKL